MRSWIMMVTMTTVTATTDMPIRMAQTRRRRMARVIGRDLGGSVGGGQPRIRANLTTPNRISRRDSAAAVDLFFGLAARVWRRTPKMNQ